jgi:hypothetical protein
MKTGLVIKSPMEVKEMKARLVVLPLLVLLSFGLTLSLTACSGGGGGGGGTTSSATITGTVLGTTFMAVDASSNAVVGSVAADPSQKTFSMQLATGKNYKFYLLENEGTTFERFYPVYVFNQGQNQNVFSITQAKTINLGFMDTATGAAVPALGLSDMESLGMSPISFNSTVPSSLAGMGFGPSDMQGAWNVHGIADNGAWFHTTNTTMTIGPNGSVDMSSLVSNNLTFGTALAGRTMSFSMTPGGVMNSPGDAEFNAFMGSSRQMFIATDLFSNAHQMFIAQKAPTDTFGTTDLCNNNGCTWQVQGIINGPAFNGWMQGNIVFDTVGNIVTGTNITRNDGSSFAFVGTVSVFPDGEIALGSFHGTMNDAKDTIAATLTDGSGDACLLILQRSTNTSHANADFGGTWYMHNVAVAAGSGNGRADFGASHFDDLGNATMERFSTNPAFTTTSSSPLSFSMTMNNQGMMSGMSGFPGMTGGAMMGGVMPGGMTQAGFSGFMNMDNSLFITNMTNTQDGNNWNMMILQK